MMGNIRFSMFLALASLLNLGIWAMPHPHTYDALVDGIYYYLDSVNRKAIVSNDWDYDYSCQMYTGDLVIPDSITYKNVVYQVDSICNGVFHVYDYYTNDELTSVTIPDGVRTIGDGLFENCAGLTSVKLGKGIRYIGKNAFSSCKALKEVNIPKGVKVIGEYAFNECAALNSIVLPDSITTVGRCVFQKCSGLTTVTLGKYTKMIREYAFDACMSLKNIDFPETIDTIRFSAFRDCESLLEVNLPDGLSEIDNDVFNGCRALTSVSIPKSVQSIGYDAFRWCTSLTDINLPEGIPMIEYATFYGCSSLPEISIPKSVKMIDREAFYNCESLSIVRFEDGPDSLDVAWDVFHGSPLRSVYLGRNLAPSSFLFKDKSNMEVVSIGDQVVFLKDRLFEGCPHIAKIKCRAAIPPQISANTFENYNAYLYVPEEHMRRYQKTNYWNQFNIIPETSDKEIDGICYIMDVAKQKAYVTHGEKKYKGDVVIPSSVLDNGVKFEVTKIISGAFEGCNRLQSVMIPKSIMDIGGNVFDGCSSLNKVVFEDSDALLHVECNFSDSPLQKLYLGRDLSYRFSPFAGNGHISALTLGFSVTELGDGMFDSCTGLQSVEISDSVENIGAKAFYYCSNLDSLVLGKQVSRIGDEAFNYCHRLMTVKSYAEVPPVIHQNVFAHPTYANAQLLVPAGTKLAYEDANNWINFVNVAEMEDSEVGYCSLMVNANEGGHLVVGDQVINNDTKQLTVKKGELLNFSVVPDSGYRIKSLVVNGVDVTDQIQEGSYTLTVSADFSITAVFEKVTLFLAIQQADNGYVRLAVEEGKSYLFSIHVLKGWQINTVTFNGVDVTDELDADYHYTTPAITESSTLNVAYELLTPSAIETLSTDRVMVRGGYGEIIVDGVVARETVKVYTVGGALVASTVAGGDLLKIEVTPGEVYVVKVGERTFKVRV